MPEYETKPVRGRGASDYEEQANTLASILRARGVKAEDVRVVLGKVNFEGSIRACMGRSFRRWYVDDERGMLVESEGLPFADFKFFPYPVIERWVYYNDRYFFDLRTKEGNPPDSWK